MTYPATLSEDDGFEVGRVSATGLSLGSITGFTLGHAAMEWAALPQTEHGNVYIRVDNEQTWEDLKSWLQHLHDAGYVISLSQ